MRKAIRGVEESMRVRIRKQNDHGYTRILHNLGKYGTGQMRAVQLCLLIRGKGVNTKRLQDLEPSSDA